MKDICGNNHGGNAESVAAHTMAEKSAADWRAWIVEKLERAAWYGKTLDELCVIASRELGREVPPNRISGRVSELKAAGTIEQSAIYPRRETRSGSGAAVLVVARYARPVQAPPPPPARPEPVAATRPPDQGMLFDMTRPSWAK